MAADAVTAVTPTFAHGSSTTEGGFGLDPVVRRRRDRLFGIVDGIVRDGMTTAQDFRRERSAERHVGVHELVRRRRGLASR